MNEKQIQNQFLASIQSVHFYFAAIFNTMFAILSTVTLCGIVFITRPQQVMHNVPPDWWIPIMIVMVPAQCLCQYLTWKTIFKRQVPSPKQIAENQFDPPKLLRPILSFLWAANFLIGFVIVVSLYKPAQGAPITTATILVVALVTFALTTFTNVYLMLLARSFTTNEFLINWTWRFRYLIDVVIALTAVIYYKMLF